MEHNLLTSLRKYRPREGQDPLENFVTEAFAWLLRNYKDFSVFFISKISENLLQPVESTNGEWSTQVSFGGIFPDMVCTFQNSTALIFEHKIWSSLHDEQLNNYRAFAKKKYEKFYLILITASKSQHFQNPDLALCWSDIYGWIETWLGSNSNETNFLLHDFLGLLKEEGLGPPAPISHEAILSYYLTRNFRNQVSSLIRRSEYKDWTSIHPEINPRTEKFRGQDYGEINGRIALLLFENACPSITTGFLLDWEHYFSPPSLGLKSPDFAIMLRFTDFHDSYPGSLEYEAFVSKLATKVQALEGDWDFYNHLQDASLDQKNKGFPIHIRKPMLEMFRGTTDPDEQVERFFEASKTIIHLFLECDEFHEMRQKFVKLS